MLNKELDLDKIRFEYLKNKRIKIDNFLDPKFAELVYSGFQDITKRNLWYQSNLGNHRHYNPNLDEAQFIYEHFTYHFEKYPVRNSRLSHFLAFDCRRLDIDPRKTNYKEIIRSMEEHPEHELEDYHPFRRVANFLNSKDTYDMFSYITGHHLTYDSVLAFASKYSQGDFMGLHDDGGHPRKFAYVMGFTKNWLPHWGGSTVITDNKREKVIETYLPSFNSIILFDVPIFHYVSPVSNYAQSDRISFTGWYFDYRKM